MSVLDFMKENAGQAGKGEATGIAYLSFRSRKMRWLPRSKTWVVYNVFGRNVIYKSSDESKAVSYLKYGVQK